MKIDTVKIIRMPTIGEMDKAGGRAALLNMYDSAHVRIMPAVTEPSISPAIYKKMAGLDTTNMMAGVVHFLTTYHGAGS